MVARSCQRAFSHVRREPMLSGPLRVCQGSLAVEEISATVADSPGQSVAASAPQGDQLDRAARCQCRLPFTSASAAVERVRRCGGSGQMTCVAPSQRPRSSADATVP